ncbi:MAG: Cu+-exporting ATPase, partial [Saprospiraceae bacterium]
MEKLIELKVDGMTCNNCAASLDKYLKRKGFEDVYVNFATKEVRFNTEGKAFSIDEVKAGIHNLGYMVVEEGNEQVSPFWTLEKKLLISALFTLPLFLGHFFMMAGIRWLAFLENPWIQLVICLPVFLIGTFHFGKSAWSSLKGGVPNMDVLIFTGSTAAFIYSLVGTLVGNPDYIFYETAATIITLVLLGNYMEKRAVEQTTTAIDDLAKLKVEKANKLNAFGEAVPVALKDIIVGDILRINEGDSIPLDGRIIKGDAIIDESMISGESIPVEKKAGNPVIGATLLIKGNIQMRVTAVGSNTVL